jgi:thiaminase/transcriptional activator TenA
MTTVDTSFRNALWKAGENSYRQILQHPFLTGLTDGSLDSNAFRHYLIQDSLYLRSYARALSLLAERAPDATSSSMFAAHAEGAIAAETGLHAELLANSGNISEPGTAIAPGTAANTGTTPADHAEEAPTTVAYTRYLLATVHEGTFAEGVAAVLPCYWIYAEVGAALRRQSSPNPVYARWIELYGSEEFAAVVNEVLELVDSLAAVVSPGKFDSMRRNFQTAARYEWMFWDAAYRLERWPV